MVTDAIRLFISHASSDTDLAARLVDLLRSALNLQASAIRCTSVDGYRLPGGADTDAQLRREVHDAEAFIGIVSSSSLRSQYVLFELGARWGAGKHLLPLLAPVTPTDLLSGPLAGLNALRADSVSQLHQLVRDIATVLSITPESPASYQSAMDRFLSRASVPASKGNLSPRQTVRPKEHVASVRPSPNKSFMGVEAGTSDTEAPRLVGFEIPSPSVDVKAGPGEVELHAHIIDDLSGVAGNGYSSSPTQVRFRSPSGRQFTDALFVPGRDQVEGTAQDGHYRSKMKLPQFAETGTWRVESFLLVDQCGNTARLSSEEMESQGFKTTITVKT